MIRTRKTLGLALALAVAAMTSSAVAQSGDIEEGINLFRRGAEHHDEALQKFHSGLAAGLSNDEAYEVFKATDWQVWRDMLVEGGEFAQVAKRVMDLSRLGKKERQNDTTAIKGILRELKSTDDAIVRTKLIRKLSADHGAYAVPFLIRPLADPGDDEWRVTAMRALTEMDTDVVLPLIEALATEDAYQRRNIALVLGYIGDPRAAGVLAAHAGSSEPDAGVRDAAADAATRCGSTGDAVAHLLQDGDDYHQRNATILRPNDYSEVVWSFDGQLVATPVPANVYPDILSKRSYARALAIMPSSLEALAGTARASIDIGAKLAAAEEAGEDVGDLGERAANSSIVAAAAGTDALDLALQWSVVTDDVASGLRLCRALGSIATAPTTGLEHALASGDGGLRGEAAAALGQIAFAAGQGASPEVIRSLGNSAGQEIVRLVAIIDADTSRAAAVAAALEQAGAHVTHRATGATGLAMLNRVPGIDAVLVGDRFPDMTVDQVLSGAAKSRAGEGTPAFLLTGDSALADAYDGRVEGTLAGADDISALDDVFSANLDGDRALADELSKRAASVLAKLASAGKSDIGPALGALTGALEGAPRADDVTVPVMGVLGTAGDASHVGALMAIATDDGRSPEARVAAADALRGIFGRYSIDGSEIATLRDVVTSDAPAEVRRAVARALGRAQLSAADRASLMADA